MSESLMPDQERHRNLLDSKGVELKNVPFELWRDGECLTFPERALDTHVFLRWHPSHAKAKNFLVGPIDRFLMDLPHDLLTGSVGHSVPVRVVNEVAKGEF